MDYLQLAFKLNKYSKEERSLTVERIMLHAKEIIDDAAVPC